MSTADEIRTAVTPVLVDRGLVVEDVTVTPVGKRRVARIAVDRALDDETGDVTDTTASLSLDEIAEATRIISDVLDAGDVMGERPYTLEVTSPGVDRPLTRPRHYQRNVGRLVRLTVHDAEPVTGRIAAADGDRVVVDVAADRRTPAERREIRYAVINRAVIEVEFSKPRSTGSRVEKES